MIFGSSEVSARNVVVIEINMIGEMYKSYLFVSREIKSDKC